MLEIETKGRKMRIAKAIEHLTSPSTGSIPFDHLELIDTETAFPRLVEVATDSNAAHKRLPFWGYDDDRHFLRVIVSGKPYSAMLAAVDPDDDEAVLCRDQIELFDRAYLGKGSSDIAFSRIPLVNIFRYCGLWMYVADAVHRPSFNSNQVKSDFATVIRGASTRYVQLLTHLTTESKTHLTTGEFGEAVRAIAWAQRVTEIPMETFVEDLREDALEQLRTLLEPETRIANTLLSSKRGAIQICREALAALRVCTAELSQTIGVEWSDAEKIRTADSDADAEFSDVVRQALTLSNILSASAPITWRLSDDNWTNELFNANLLERVRTLLHSHPGQRLEGVGKYLSDHLLLREPIPGLAEERVAVLNAVETLEGRLNNHPYLSQPLHSVVRLRLFLAFYAAALQSGQIAEYMTECETLGTKLDSIMAGCKPLTAPEIHSLHVRLSHAWPEWQPAFGFAFHFREDLGSEILSGSPDDARQLLHGRYGPRGERLHLRLATSSLSVFFAKCLSAFSSPDCRWMTEVFESCGLVVTGTNCCVEQTSTLPKIRYGENMSSAWEEHDAEYLELRSDEETWKAALHDVEYDVKRICDQVLSSEPEAGRRVDLQLKVKKWRGNIKAVMVLRWVLFTVEKYELDLNRRMYLLGWLRSFTLPDEEVAKSLEAFRNYFWKRGLILGDDKVASAHSLHWPEEDGWLTRYRPPQ